MSGLHVLSLSLCAYVCGPAVVQPAVSCAPAIVWLDQAEAWRARSGLGVIPGQGPTFMCWSLPFPFPWGVAL